MSLKSIIQENRVLTNANENVNNKPERFECLRSPSYEQPLKVFSKVQSTSGLPNEMILDRGSCHAVRTAVSTLYNFEDFEMVKIGEGFFSEVYKVQLIIYLVRMLMSKYSITDHLCRQIEQED
jgi:hypothetical protein